jgi:uncharacterized tellurite resistance protein B-like protein
VGDKGTDANAVFRSTVEVMLSDGILTREEKRLIIKLASALDLTPEMPGTIYADIREDNSTVVGRIVDAAEQRGVYTRVYEVAIVNASLSQDEFRVLAHLREIFSIDDDEHSKIEKNLQEIMEERFDDNKNFLDKMLNTLKDSVSLVGGFFDSVRTKSA